MSYNGYDRNLLWLSSEGNNPEPNVGESLMRNVVVNVNVKEPMESSPSIQEYSNKENQMDCNSDDDNDDDDDNDNDNDDADDADDADDSDDVDDALDEKDLTNLTWLTESSHEAIRFINIPLDELWDNEASLKADNRDVYQVKLRNHPNCESVQRSEEDGSKRSSSDHNTNKDPIRHYNNNNRNCNVRLNQRGKGSNRSRSNHHHANNASNNHEMPHRRKSWPTPIERYEMFIKKIKKDLEMYKESVIDYQIDVSSKPPFNYSHIIGMAMLESGRSTLRQICAWIERKFAFFRIRKKWNNSIRHNLSLHPCFRKISRKKEEKGKGGYWELGIDDRKFSRKRIRHRRTMPEKINKEPSKADHLQLLSKTSNMEETTELLEAVNPMSECMDSRGRISNMDANDLAKKTTSTSESEPKAQSDFLKTIDSDCATLDTVIIRSTISSYCSAASITATDILDLINATPNLLGQQPSIELTTQPNRMPDTDNGISNHSAEHMPESFESNESDEMMLENHLNRNCLTKKAKQQEEEQKEEQEQEQQQQQEPQLLKRSVILEQSIGSVYLKNMNSPSQIMDTDNIPSYVDYMEESFHYLRSIQSSCCDDSLLDNILDISVSEL